MKNTSRRYVFLLALSMILGGCSVSKFIPEGKYLLDKVTVESDNKEIRTADMYLYIRQNENAKWFSVWKLPMYIYGASGLDSTKWMNRMWRKIGDAPVIFDSVAAEDTRQEMKKAVQNMGYMRAAVDVEKKIKGKKLALNYKIRSGDPYIVNRVTYDIQDLQIRSYMYEDSASNALKEGMRFDVNALESERQRVTQYLQNCGFYRFNKEFIVFQADTVLNTKKVDLTFRLLPYQRKIEDEPTNHIRYNIRNVVYQMDTDNPFGGDKLDSININGINFFFRGKPFLRPKMLANYNSLVPDTPYRNMDVQETYSDLARLNILRYSNIRFTEVDEGTIDAYVSLSRGKNKSMSFEVEGTNSAGDLGAAAAIQFTHRNLFRGAETFSVKLRGAYEAITGLEDYDNDNYLEYGIEASLNFPDFKFPFLSHEFKRRIKATSEVSVKFNNQIRPEFERTLASASWSYRWTRQKSTHRLDLLDINYVYMPYTSEAFSEYLDQMDEVNPLLRYSYEDQLIVRLGYTYTYNSVGNSLMAAKRNSYTVRISVEESGNLLYAFSKIFNGKPNDGEAYQLANINFAQYIRGDFDYARNFMIDERNQFVFHVGLGIGYPYGNSQSLPFEKLYFSGGANSVRGWSVRSLGPGGYAGDGNAIDYVNRTGDLKLDFNIEYRTFLFWKFNGAVFVDAGNIWNIKSEEGYQEEGLFKFNRFYKQLAVAYGLGLRFDLDFLIIRFDGGMKAVNPMKSGKQKYPIFRPKMSRDFAFHFAVGYPF